MSKEENATSITRASKEYKPNKNSKRAMKITMTNSKTLYVAPEKDVPLNIWHNPCAPAIPN